MATKNQITKVVIHCSATTNGKPLRNARETAAQAIDRWHKDRGYKRPDAGIKRFNPNLKHIGYHAVIDTDGTIEFGREIGEIGAHVKGHNVGSIGICLVGGVGEGKEKYHGRYTEAQWHALSKLLITLAPQCSQAEIVGHRDLSPDLNGDGTITPNEWLKNCPCFDVREWLERGETVFVEHLYKDK
ncbi:N-acetylmuramoyl-L-alanine amidase [[Haemophilus] felis]|uniref:N-acetylmuramoyl-L-alanine amidase n=1 Tax=[Haemophilus] felis TaxID=123822 RepID=A0A1T0B796_9PAST|nr:N-acetylmuramoyl-L-alanine amidase [[Haemophilus] felis]OOS05862.1 N-acetylmuramoyl-L-alanine amidase [[Haemophilus] felis]